MNLATVLQTLSQHATDIGHSETLADLDEAVEVSRAAVAAIPVDHPRRPMLSNSLARSLRDRFARTGRLADVDEAVLAARESLRDVPPDHSDRCSHLHDLSRILYTRFEQTRDDADADAALDGWREAVILARAPAATRLYAAHSWGHAAAARGGNWELAADGYAKAVELLPLVAWRGLSRADREHWLDSVRGLGGDAAACAIAAGQPDRALELLESSRGVLWSQLLDTRTDLLALRVAAPQLADALEATREELESLNAERQRAASYRWDELVEAARTLPGFEGFLRPPAATHLRTAASGGPVVVVNISQWRCDAIVVITDAATVVPLPELTRERAWEQTFQFLNAVDDLAEAFRLGTIIAAEGVITEVLQWLWDMVAAPVLAALGHVHACQTASRGRSCGGVRAARLPCSPCTPLAITTRIGVRAASPSWTE